MGNIKRYPGSGVRVCCRTRTGDWNWGEGMVEVGEVMGGLDGVKL